MEGADLVRLDKLLIERGHVPSRPRAERMISEHGVHVNGTLVQKPGKKVPQDAVLELVVEDMPWVSRGALKLLSALDTWTDLTVKGKRALDVGCSTGGFSHVLLERGALAVLGVDTGRDQFDPGLADDPRMVVRESTNVKDLTPAEVDAVMGGLPELVVIDVSFVGLSHIFPCGGVVDPAGHAGGGLGQAPVRSGAGTLESGRHRARPGHPGQGLGSRQGFRNCPGLSGGRCP